MDILEIVRAQVNALPDGPHLNGLRSVLRHIDAAHRHLSRGQSEGDESAYSDALYRSNQAFEGSIKEAYRVLAGKDPQKTTPYNIENYLQENDLFRTRVLAQFKNYRTEWRNPSTHDYNLDFDEDEAFLAIVSVSAFAKMLIDQITEKLAFDEIVENAVEHPIAMPQQQGLSLIDEVTEAFIAYLQRYKPDFRKSDKQIDVKLSGFLSGFLSLMANKPKVETHEFIDVSGSFLIADMLITRGNDQVVIEIRRNTSPDYEQRGLVYLETIFEKTNIKSGILLIYAHGTKSYQSRDIELKAGTDVKIIEPD